MNYLYIILINYPFDSTKLNLFYRDISYIVNQGLACELGLASRVTCLSSATDYSTNDFL